METEGNLNGNMNQRLSGSGGFIFLCFMDLLFQVKSVQGQESHLEEMELVRLKAGMQAKAAYVLSHYGARVSATRTAEQV